MRKQLILLFMLLMHVVTGTWAQTETSAFYIYQNDGHFDGFFYDEVKKISYSKTDTAGVEYDIFVTQVIETADSTYRIMLSAIDSVGFVQPEIKYNPRLRLVKEDQLFTKLISHDAEYGQLVFANSTPAALMPKVGDVFASFDIENGWSGKVTAVSKNADGSIAVTCSPISEITDIFERFVMLEQYDHDRNGQMVRRRVAGHPELTIGRYPGRRASEGTWEGDLFNFSVSGHIPLYSKDDLSITIDPSIEGKLHIKTAWNLSFWGDKAINILAKLDFGVGIGFTVDGQITDFFPGGVGGLMGGVPVPATCPLIYLDVSPDAFIRGDAHVKFSAQSPRLKGGMWTKLEIMNWWPSMDTGFGSPDGATDFQAVDTGSAGVSLELSGYVQGGMLFCMDFKSLPVLEKLFSADLGGFWYVGPKLSGSVALDLTTMPWEDEATYTLMKNTKLSLHMLDADFEVTGKVKTAFSGTKRLTLLDGGINVFPPADAAVVPEFGDCKESVEERFFYKRDLPAWSSAPDELNATKQQCRVFTFEPSGFVMFPVYSGTALYKKNDAGEYVLVEKQNFNQMYYHLHLLMGQELPQEQLTKFIMWDNDAIAQYDDGDYKVCPIVTVMGKEFVASPAYEFKVGGNDGGKILMSPNFVHVDFKIGGYGAFADGEYTQNNEPAETDGIYYEDWYQDIERAMQNNNAGMKPNEAGNINFNGNGISMSGTYDKDDNQGSGTFTLKTETTNEVMTVEQVKEAFSSMSGYTGFLSKNGGKNNLMMNGKITHEAEGTFTVKKSGGKYVFTFAGKGTYKLDATAFNEIRNPHFLPIFDLTYPDPIEVYTTKIQQNGNMKMDYQVEVK
ncbi:MAG: hypothetical protein J6W52_13175 [Bacteroidaceae bacterium]|nr:hypothetical protein [Bacteroidaceae bacterium]